MKNFSIPFIAIALVGMVAASGAQAGGLYDDDDNGYSGNYNRQSLSQYCRENPYDDECAGYRRQHEPRRSYKKSYHDGRCAPLIRAVGKRNLVTAFARNSARFAWSRETRFVHGDQYANWNYARNAEIVCTRVGAVKSCVAKAIPCRY